MRGRCGPVLLCAAVTLVLGLAGELPARAGQSQAVRPSAALGRPASKSVPPPKHELSARQVVRIAGREQKLRDELRRYARHSTEAFTKGPRRWQVSYYARGEEVAQVVVDERRGSAVEIWTGPQVAWQMARGLPGAFGRRANAPYVWIPLMAAFLLPFFDWRRPFRLLHLDLAVLLALSLSLLYFNRGEIFTSVPLVYPVLVYLLARMLLFGYVRRFRAPQALRPLVPVPYLALATVFLVGFRVGLNLTNSNVIDVGYSGVVGADRLTHGEPVYGGGFPVDDRAGDTYGPVSYYAYVPFELLFPWSGSWDGLPAAHAAALAFDLATLVGLYWVGRRLRPGRQGTALGVTLAYAWASYPFTLLVLSSNANDSLVAALLVLSFLALRSDRLRGGLLALASATKFVPLALVPLYSGYASGRRTLARFGGAFVVVAVLAMVPVLWGGGPAEFWERTLGFQLGRDSPFSVWGQEQGLAGVQDAVKVAVAALSLAVALVPRHRDALQVAALGAAVLIALELSLSHWFYLYVVWFFPFVMIALLGQQHWHLKRDRRGRPAGDEAPSGLAL